MLSDEEKNAIEWLKSKINEYVIKSELDENIGIILNLIEKQSKEIEELKKEYERVRAGRNWLSEHITAQIATPELFDRLVEENYISKDKIRLKMKQEMDKGYRLSEERHLQNYAYDRLKELLEE